MPALALGPAVADQSGAAAAPSSSAVEQPLTSALAAQLSRNVDQNVIVVMRKQLAVASSGTKAVAARSEVLARDQVPVMEELRQVHAAHIHAYRLVDAIAATVSKGEEARLKANPAVEEVTPNVTIEGAQLGQGSPQRQESPLDPSSLRNSPAVAGTIPGACLSSGSSLAPEGLSLTSTDSDDPAARTARSLGITGSGVTVAYVADGIDPRNVNLVRSDGSSVVADSQDFSGDGLGEPTDGALAFSDANTIAGQGQEVYDVSDFSAEPDPSACNIRIEGVAPGSTLVGLDVYGLSEETTESDLLQAIDYAVDTEHVDVLEESFGSIAFPDVAPLDVLDMFNDAAVAAGVVVTVSSGDAGSTNTIGSPASDPNVISVGASTELQSYAQTNDALARDFASTGWLDDNVSSLSSGGSDESGGTVDLVAPGDMSFASCDASATFEGCVDATGQSSDVEAVGGTGEASSFVAGAAALVIQAYRQTHSGESPSPALVKQILVSTATDLGAPADEQGAGLLNSYKAVQMAESISTGTRTGVTLLKSVTQLDAADLPGTDESWPVTITNTGSKPQLVLVQGRTLGSDRDVQTGSVTLADNTSPQFTDWQGIPNNYSTFSFTVPTGQARLDASIAYPGDPASGDDAEVGLVLVDPEGRLAGYSSPQGVGNFGNVDVTKPAAGTWTGVVFGPVAADGGTNGTIPWRVATEQYEPFGSVSPSTVLLAPGQSQQVTVSATTPSSPGDEAGAIVFDSVLGGGGVTTIPVTLRSTVDVAGGGTFSGVLTGGNGKADGGQVDYYEFGVGSGVADITANVSLSNDAGDQVGAYLVSPAGTVLGYGQNSVGGVKTSSLTAYTLDPIEGDWTLVVDFAEPVVGDEISQAFTGDITFNDTRASAAGLPDSASTTLATGTPVTVPVSITNRGAQAGEFFIDPRLDTSETYTLSPLDTVVGMQLPLPTATAAPQWFVPTEVSSVTFDDSASLPNVFTAALSSGDPDLGSTTGTSADLTYTPASGPVPDGVWYAEPSEVGPFPSPAPAGTVSMTASISAKAFDRSITSSVGDVCLTSIDSSNTATPVTIDSGATATINVTITPSASTGTVVSGELYVDDYLPSVPPDGQEGVDELAAIPYEYTVGD